MPSENNIALPEDLMSAVSETAQAQGRTPNELIVEATRRYLSRERLDRFVRRSEQRARDLGIVEADVPRLVKESRHQHRGR